MIASKPVLQMFKIGMVFKVGPFLCKPKPKPRDPRNPTWTGNPPAGLEIMFTHTQTNRENRVFDGRNISGRLDFRPLRQVKSQNLAAEATIRSCMTVKF